MRMEGRKGRMAPVFVYRDYREFHSVHKFLCGNPQRRWNGSRSSGLVKKASSARLLLNDAHLSAGGEAHSVAVRACHVVARFPFKGNCVAHFTTPRTTNAT